MPNLVKVGPETRGKNILGLPSLTGFTPLKALASEQTLKYDFRGFGPRVLDKSGSFHGGTLKPLWPVNSPRRSRVNKKTVLTFDGKAHYLDMADIPELRETFTIIAKTKHESVNDGDLDRVVCLKANNWMQLEDSGRGRMAFTIVDENEERHTVTGPISNGEWNTWKAVVEPYEGGTAMRLYKNGEMQEGIPGPAMKSYGSKGMDTVGAQQVAGPTKLFNGSIEFVEIYNRAV